MELWQALADELKLPLVQIARSAELGETEAPRRQLRIVETTADNALRLIDSYLLVSNLSQKQLELMPVSVTATLYEVAEDLRPLARLYDTQIDIEVQGATGQVMAHAEGLRAALTSLAYTFITGGLKARRQRLTLLVQPTKDGVNTGVVSAAAHLTNEDLQSARQLYGRAQQPAGGLTQNSGVGLYLADNLFGAMESPLHVIRTGRKSGLVATLLPSRQLALL